ncbi:MAG: Bax inhibitor-1/YccA family protein [Euryarchaeota archaeon]|nr:Bax inhibitor-1/YccA family protein [Euryarchaeota archaeon]MBT5595091.1 Bax inhibitor-1/YccA family protein [Euryarchaeota archaeon]MBT5844860.1 Bax inhibitor-1/YccA family protein [Euryarchaeota archaeon]MBT6845753.1 Bax inhibitor-1/YccA family protein [Euryarchaeota archaeon]MBT7063622.1 Bax inhibitor-1/YccA family protein [Euryarchaeota archaeon]
MVYSSSNPVLSNRFWNNISGYETMSYEGTMQKIGILFGTMAFSALMLVTIGITIDMNFIFVGAGVGFVGGLIAYLILLFKRPENPAGLMITYAIFEGLLIGGFSMIFESMYEGIVFQAALGTVCITGTMYGLYATRIIKATPMLKKVIFTLTGGIMMLYLVSIILYLLPSNFEVPFLHTSGPVGILLTVFILTVASFLLIINFDFIEKGIQHRTPKVGEWWGAFGLLVTVVWIYIEMLRLLAKIRSNFD